MMLQYFLQIIWKQICVLNHDLYSMLTVLPTPAVNIHLKTAINWRRVETGMRTDTQLGGQDGCEVSICISYKLSLFSPFAKI